ncbi:hypothetical protein HK096_005896 [Nowakowskiella sp. JEL0078]|nr:hypothetical protein HK096_005896 [Nowakowskiella sp. JEL0078]
MPPANGCVSKLIVIFILIFASYVNATLLYRSEVHSQETFIASECVLPPAGTIEEQCAYIREICVDRISGFINYLQFYYCSSLRIVPFLIMFGILCLMFLMLSTAASEFLAVSLSNISTWLSLSETVSGVTLAAFGNAAPDLFSTYSAFSNNVAGLALGELMGGASFISMVVVGMIAIITPFQLPRRPFLRDIIYFMIAVLAIVMFAVDGKITFWGGVGFVLYYTVYVTVVVGGHYLNLKDRNTILLEDEIEEQYDSTEGSNLLGSLYGEPIDLEQSYDSHYYHSLRQEAKQSQTSSDVTSNRSFQPSVHLNNAFELPSNILLEENSFIQEDILGPPSSHQSPRSIPIQIQSVLETLFPIINEWNTRREMRLIDQIYHISLVPVYATLRLTVPLISSEEMETGVSNQIQPKLIVRARSIDLDLSDDGFEVRDEDLVPARLLTRELILVQCFSVPMFALFALSDFSWGWAWLVSVFLGSLIFVPVMWVTKSVEVVKFGKIVSALGFLMSVLWISGIEIEVS